MLQQPIVRAIVKTKGGMVLLSTSGTLGSKYYGVALNSVIDPALIPFMSIEKRRNRFIRNAIVSKYGFRSARIAFLSCMDQVSTTEQHQTKARKRITSRISVSNRVLFRRFAWVSRATQLGPPPGTMVLLHRLGGLCDCSRGRRRI